MAEGEVGCLFDEIDNLVEPTERPAMDGRTGLSSHGRRGGARTERPGQLEENTGSGRGRM
jgi:hypothetical protein